MKKTTLLKASTLVLFAVMSCNKTKVTPPPVIKNSDAKQGQERVEEKMYNLTPEQVKSSINFLTASDVLNQSASKGFKPESNLPPDSSLWVLEAALNYHFDKDPKDHDVYEDSVAFSAPLTFENGAVWVSPSDFINVYNQFKSAITQKSAGLKKVKLIDIRATIDFPNGQINYKGEIVFALPTPANCQPFPNSSFPKIASWSSTWGVGCISPAAYGDIMCENKLNNCNIFGCQNLFYTNITTYMTNNINGAFSSSLFFISPHSNILCENLGGSSLNQYVNGCKNIALANLPVTPGVIMVNYNITENWAQLNFSTTKLWWNVTVKYAKPNCGNPNNT